MGNWMMAERPQQDQDQDQDEEQPLDHEQQEEQEERRECGGGSNDTNDSKRASNGEEEDVEEEDWSALIGASSGSFARHDNIREFTMFDDGSGRKKSLRIASVSDLSPLDMMNLSQGTHDATGHKVWLGAEFFVSVIRMGREGDATCRSVLSHFAGKKVIELGAGTGLAGISLGFLPTDDDADAGNEHDKDLHCECDSAYGPPIELVLTDADEAAIELCERNCELNADEIADTLMISSRALRWGTTLDKDDESRYDTVLATDIFYSMESLDPFLRTVVGCLRQGGCLILVHVPRASMPGKASVATAFELERCIFTEAAQMGLTKEVIIRPRHIGLTIDGVDAAIIILRKG